MLSCRSAAQRRFFVSVLYGDIAGRHAARQIFDRHKSLIRFNYFGFEVGIPEMTPR
jgi:hypothetical protein